MEESWTLYTEIQARTALQLCKKKNLSFIKRSTSRDKILPKTA